MSGAYGRGFPPGQMTATLGVLRWGQWARALGAFRSPRAGVQPPVSFWQEPGWLVNAAINRKAGWPDDPTYRGSCRPSDDGRYPPAAEAGSPGRYRDVERLARMVNTPRLIVRWRDCPKRYHARLAHRLTWPGQEE
jgi:hypothetical protein